MRNRGLFCGLGLAAATCATESPIALAQEMDRVPVQLSAFLHRYRQTFHDLDRLAREDHKMWVICKEFSGGFVRLGLFSPAALQATAR
jgi:hypothetical protein